MKANELMIGDWVMYNPNVFIEDEYETPKESYPIQISNGDDIDLAIEDCYSPIPLAKEILEKNGFEEFDGWSIFIPENTGIEIAWLGTILKIGGECGNLELPAIEYVHQLQHALRLCGIKKEIEL